MVIHDFTACNSTELTIRRGQTVEVLERPHDKPDWCLVRTTDRSPAAEGLVPCGSLCIAHSRSSMEMEGIFNHKGRDREARLARAQLLPLLLCSLVRGTVSPRHSCFPPLSLCLWAFLIHQELEWEVKISPVTQAKMVSVWKKREGSSSGASVVHKLRTRKVRFLSR